MRQETIFTWHDAESSKPDSDMTVLLDMPGAESEPVWPGYWDDGEGAWLTADGAPLTDKEVKAWAEMPTGVATRR